MQKEIGFIFLPKLKLNLKPTRYPLPVTCKKKIDKHGVLLPTKGGTIKAACDDLKRAMA